MKRVIISAVAFLLCGAINTLYADVVHLKTGGKVEGKVTDLGSELKVEGAIGTTTISKDKVVSIEKKETSYEVYLSKLAGLKTDDVDGRYQLGLWCKENKLNSQAKKEFEAVIGINPDHEDVRKELGYVKYDGKWMTEDEAKIAQGYVKYKGTWFKKEDYEVRKKYDDEQERKKKVTSVLQQQINRFALRSEKSRNEAYEKAVTIAEENGISDLKPWLADVKARYDKAWDTIIESERRNVKVEMYGLYKTDLLGMPSKDLFDGTGTNIQLPNINITGAQGTVVIPGGR